MLSLPAEKTKHCFLPSGIAGTATVDAFKLFFVSARTNKRHHHHQRSIFPPFPLLVSVTGIPPPVSCRWYFNTVCEDIERGDGKYMCVRTRNSPEAEVKDFQMMRRDLARAVLHAGSGGPHHPADPSSGGSFATSSGGHTTSRGATSRRDTSFGGPFPPLDSFSF